MNYFFFGDCYFLRPFVVDFSFHKSEFPSNPSFHFRELLVSGRGWLRPGGESVKPWSTSWSTSSSRKPSTSRGGSGRIRKKLSRILSDSCCAELHLKPVPRVLHILMVSVKTILIRFEPYGNISLKFFVISPKIRRRYVVWFSWNSHEDLTKKNWACPLRSQEQVNEKIYFVNLIFFSLVS